MWISYTTYNARTGPVEFRFPYNCSLCGVEASALVQAEGSGSSTAVYGRGGDPAGAQRTALDAAQRNAMRALRCAPCPQCHTLQPQLVAEFEAVARTAARRRSRRARVAVAAAAAVALLLAIPAIYDRAHSTALLWAALAATVFVGSGVFTLFGWPPPTPSFVQGKVSFWRFSTQEWIPAPRPTTMPPVEPPSKAHFLSAGLAALSGPCALAAFVVWVNTFQFVYVLHPERQGGDLTIRVDGVTVDDSDTTRPNSDASVHRVTVRTDRQHRVEVLGVDGSPRTYDLPEGAGHGWVIAPEGFSRGLCVFEVRAVYSRYRDASGPETEVDVLNRDTEVLALRRSYDDMFRPPPETVSIRDRSETETRWTLRAASCAALRANTLVPFRASAPVARVY